MDFPLPLLKATEQAASELATDRSKLIRSAVELFLQLLHRKRLEQELAEGYRANAAFDREICREFAHVDAENI